MTEKQIANDNNYYLSQFGFLMMKFSTHQTILSTMIKCSLLTGCAVIGTAVFADDTVQQLPTIEIKAAQEDTYTVKESKAATKLDLSLKETPQSVTVITQQQIKDQNLTSTSEILAQTPGITSIQYGQEGAGYSTYYSRGFAITNVQRDGIPTTTASFGGSDMFGLEDSAIYDRIEITKGSTGLTSGSGNPSASINYVRKRPSKDLTGSIHVQGGSWDNYRSQIDVGGALNDEGSIRGRTVAVYEQGGNQQDRYHRQNAVFYGALDFDLSKNTVLTTALTAQQVKLNNATAHGFPFITHDGQKQVTFDRKDNAAANFTYSDTEKLNVFVGLEHQFNDNWSGVANYAFTKASNQREYGVAGSGGITYDVPYRVNAGLTLQPGEMVVTSGRFESTPTVHSVDVYTSGKFNAFGQEHSVSFGLNDYHIESDDPSFGRYYTATAIEGWNGNSPRPDMQQTGRTIVDEQQLGAFAAAKLQLLDPLKLIIGSRFSNWERKATNNEQKQNGVFTPYAGLVFDITDHWSAYTSYTTIFNPSSRKDKNEDYVDPEEGNSFELGLKADFYDGRLNASAAYFDMKQDNFAVQDLSADAQLVGFQPYIAIDGAKVKGYELSVAGEVLANWNIQAGYTHTDAKDQTGNILNSQLPEDTFKLFTTYKWDKFTLGGGVNWQSEFYNAAATGLAAKLTRQDSYYLVNLMGRYQVNDDIALGINVNNLLDEEYKLNISNSWGAGRNITASLNYKF